MTAPRRHLSLVPPAPASGVVIKRRPKDPEADLYSPACDTIEGECHRECRHRLPAHRCVLIVARRGWHSLEDMAVEFRMSHQAVRATLLKALRKFRFRARKDPQLSEHVTNLIDREIERP